MAVIADVKVLQAQQMPQRLTGENGPTGVTGPANALNAYAGLCSGSTIAALAAGIALGIGVNSTLTIKSLMRNQF